MLKFLSYENLCSASGEAILVTQRYFIKHFTQSRFPNMLYDHFTQSLYQNTRVKHFIKAIYPNPIKLLYQGNSRNSLDIHVHHLQLHQDKVLRTGNKTMY